METGPPIFLEFADEILSFLVQHGQSITISKLAAELKEPVEKTQIHVFFIVNGSHDLFAVGQLPVGGSLLHGQQGVVIYDKQVRKIKAFLDSGGFVGRNEQQRQFRHAKRLKEELEQKEAQRIANRPLAKAIWEEYKWWINTSIGLVVLLITGAFFFGSHWGVSERLQNCELDNRILRSDTARLSALLSACLTREEYPNGHSQNVTTNADCQKH
jgi:hypothetical protein